MDNKVVLHDHTLVARARETQIPQTAMWEMGCHECGPQWLITVDWPTMKIRIAWLNLPYTVTLLPGAATWS